MRCCDQSYDDVVYVAFVMRCVKYESDGSIKYCCTYKTKSGLSSSFFWEQRSVKVVAVRTLSNCSNEPICNLRMEKFAGFHDKLATIWHRLF